MEHQEVERLTAESLLRRLEGTVEAAQGLLDAAIDDGDLRTAVGAVRELRASLVTLAQAVAAADGANLEALAGIPEPALDLVHEAVETVTVAGEDPATVFGRAGLAVCASVTAEEDGEVVTRWRPLTEVYQPLDGGIPRAIVVHGELEDLPEGDPLRDADPSAHVILVGG